MSPRIRFNKKTRSLIFEKYQKRCAYCGKRIKENNFSIDHIFPLLKGGSNEIENLNPSCNTCNYHKGTFTIDDFRIEISKKIDRELRSSSNLRLLKSFGKIKLSRKDIVFYFEKVKE